LEAIIEVAENEFFLLLGTEFGVTDDAGAVIEVLCEKLLVTG